MSGEDLAQAVLAKHRKSVHRRVRRLVIFRWAMLAVTAAASVINMIYHQLEAPFALLNGGVWMSIAAVIPQLIKLPRRVLRYTTGPGGTPGFPQLRSPGEARHVRLLFLAADLTQTVAVAYAANALDGTTSSAVAAAAIFLTASSMAMWLETTATVEHGESATLWMNVQLAENERAAHREGE